MTVFTVLGMAIGQIFVPMGLALLTLAIRRRDLALAELPQLPRRVRVLRKRRAADVWRRMLDYHIVHQRYLETAREFGLNPGATKLLLELEHDDPRPMRALAETFACDASNVTWMVDQLEERGLVERRTLRNDRRVKTVALASGCHSTSRVEWAGIGSTRMGSGEDMNLSD